MEHQRETILYLNSSFTFSFQLGTFSHEVGFFPPQPRIFSHEDAIHFYLLYNIFLLHLDQLSHEYRTLREKCYLKSSTAGIVTKPLLYGKL